MIVCLMLVVCSVAVYLSSIFLEGRIASLSTMEPKPVREDLHWAESLAIVVGGLVIGIAALCQITTRSPESTWLRLSADHLVLLIVVMFALIVFIGSVALIVYRLGQIKAGNHFIRETRRAKMTPEEYRREWLDDMKDEYSHVPSD